MFIDMNVVFIWIGNTKPHLRRFTLAASVFFFLLTTCPFERGSGFAQSCQYFVWLPIFEYTKLTRNAIPSRKVVDLLPELSSRPDW